MCVCVCVCVCVCDDECECRDPLCQCVCDAHLLSLTHWIGTPPLQYLSTAFPYFSQSLGASNALSCVNRTDFRTVCSLRLTDIAVAL